MKVEICWPKELPENINGVAVVCDVWAATSNINSFLSRKVKKLLVVDDNNVQDVKEKYKNSLVIGESVEFPKTFFDASNYPLDIERTNIEDEVILYMSNNGTKVIELAFEKNAKQVLTVSFSNLKTMGEYLRSSEEEIYLLPSRDLHNEVVEDLVCVQSLKKFIRGNDVNLDKIKEEAKSAITIRYGAEGFDQAANFKILFQNNLDIIPICEKTNGFINVFNGL